ncbi:hypothetical protein [Ruegeria jejuensis]|uniref:hypothetical protein n=1 Tax=Ruegeria jejuensis TaxID=3233338 RepID=UPI00355AE465
MSDPVTVDANEFDYLRLYALDVAPEHAKFLREPGAAEQLLGVEGLDSNEIEIFPVWDLEGFGLHGYMSEGCGIPEDQLDAEALDKIMGWVMLVRSAAFRGKAMDLTLDNRLEPVGCFSEDRIDWSAEPLITKSAEPYSAPRTPPREARARSVRIGLAIFSIVMIAVLAGLLWLIL